MTSDELRPLVHDAMERERRLFRIRMYAALIVLGSVWAGSIFYFVSQALVWWQQHCR